MKKSIKTLVLGLLLVPVLAASVMPLTASAVKADCTGTAGLVNATADPSMCVPLSCQALTGASLGACTSKPTDGADNLFGSGGIFQTITNTALFIIGALSVIMLIFGGIKYTISGGEAKAVESAKNTIMYAVIGIVVALLAFAIVNFVLTTLIK